MSFLDPRQSPVLVVAIVLLLSLFAFRLRQQRGAGKRRGRRSKQPPREALDTVAAWHPEATRVLSISERQACEQLKRAIPGVLVLAQVPLSRFLRVPTRHSYSEWMQRAGSLSADLLVCDSASRVLAVIDIRSSNETERSRRRHDRLKRVLKAAGIKVYAWREGQLPTVAELRSGLATELMPPDAAPRALNSRGMPLESGHGGLDALLAERDAQFYDTGMEPVPSGFYDDERESVRGELSRV